ncbi:hypothetical protein, partial [Mitsuokella jalaludinii]
ARLKELEKSYPLLEQALADAKAEAMKWKTAYDDLRERALRAYNSQKREIEELKKRLGEE